MRELTPKQARFVDEYLIDLNATQAAIRAGYSSAHAESIGCRLVKKSQVSDAIRKRRDALASRYGVTQERIIEEYARIAFSTMRDYATFGAGGVTLKESGDISDDAMRAISEVAEKRSDTGSEVRFKLHDKKGALDSLAKHLGMFIDRHEITGKDGGPIEIESAKAELNGLLVGLALRIGAPALAPKPK